MPSAARLANKLSIEVATIGTFKSEVYAASTERESFV